MRLTDDWKPHQLQLVSPSRWFPSFEGPTAKRLNENLYLWPDSAPTAYGGQGPAELFGEHVMERLTEAFAILKWIAENRRDEFDGG